MNALESRVYLAGVVTGSTMRGGSKPFTRGQCRREQVAAA